MAGQLPGRGRRPGPSFAAIAAVALAAFVVVGPGRRGAELDRHREHHRRPAEHPQKRARYDHEHVDRRSLRDRLHHDRDPDRLRRLRGSGRLGVRARLVGGRNQLAPGVGGNRGNRRRQAGRRPGLRQGRPRRDGRRQGDGAHPWTATAYQNIGCTGNLNKPATILMAVARPAHAGPDRDADAATDTRADGHADARPDGHPGPHGHANLGPDGQSVGCADPDPRPDAERDTGRHRATDGLADPDADAWSRGLGRQPGSRRRRRRSDGLRQPGAQRRPHPEAARDPGRRSGLRPPLRHGRSARLRGVRLGCPGGDPHRAGAAAPGAHRGPDGRRDGLAADRAPEDRRVRLESPSAAHRLHLTLRWGAPRLPPTSRTNGR